MAEAGRRQPRPLLEIHQAVGRVLRPFKEGVQPGTLAAMMRLPCIARLCMRVQLIDGAIYVVAPTALRPCQRSDGSRSSWCEKKSRVKQPGASVPGFWSDEIYPVSTEWHFWAGLNMSSCYAEPIPGDYLHGLARARMHNALRLLLGAYERQFARGRLPQPVELVMCFGETAVNLGDWCMKGPQPIWGMTSNERSPLIPFVQRTFRDADLQSWADNPNLSGHRGIPAAAWAKKQDVAVFRGAPHRLNVYSDRWRERGARRTAITADNWRGLGRLALLKAKAEFPSLLNVHVGSGEVGGHSDGLRERLEIGHEVWGSQDTPAKLSLEEQADSFKYMLNVEGHGGWADRLLLLLFLPALVLNQDMPARLWFETSLKPWQHYVPVDSNLRNLSAAITWAREHDDEARKIAERGRAVALRWLAPAAVFTYAEELLLQYEPLMHYTPSLDARAVRFNCANDSAAHIQCFFTAPSKESAARKKRRHDESSRFSSVLAASLALFSRRREDGACVGDCFPFNAHPPECCGWNLDG